MFVPGELINEVITANHANYSLKDMINPTFQNDGEATVFIDGRIVKKGESYAINAPNVILQNEISITFEPDQSKSKILYVGFVKTIL
ncbi:hypothetical protein ACM55F_10010 [Flavobacterium sp. XS2P12]|uniref:hypothetical protein n=1 Tax=Flavobacterium melibiosi TaxID=3398734 RepID=UPI003A89DAB3